MQIIPALPLPVLPVVDDIKQSLASSPKSCRGILISVFKAKLERSEDCTLFSIRSFLRLRYYFKTKANISKIKFGGFTYPDEVFLKPKLEVKGFCFLSDPFCVRAN